MIDQLKPLLKKLTVFAKMNLKFERPPRLFLKRDSENASAFLGKTAHYDPQNSAITLFISGRHPKDILRSFTHELVHHCQNERGDLAPEKMKSMTNGYAQECPHMRKMEQEAYLQGSMCFRDWEDGLDDKLQYKMQIAEQKFLKENKNMSVKISKKELKGLIEKLLESRLSEQSEQPVKNNCPPKKLKNGTMETQAQANKRCNAADQARVDGQLEADKAAEEKARKKEYQANKDALEASFVKSRTSLEEEQVEEGSCGGKKEDSKTSKKKNCPGAKCPGCPECKPGLKKENEEIEEGRKCPECGKAKCECPKESIEENEEIEEADKPMCKHPKTGKMVPCYTIDGSGANDEKPKSESRIQTPEQENTLYESRFTQRNTRLFEKLLKEWTK